VSMTSIQSSSGTLSWVNIQALGLPLRRVIAGYVSAAGAVLMSWLCVVSGMIAGCVRRGARAFRGSA
jgi:hypothetical protein